MTVLRARVLTPLGPDEILHLPDAVVSLVGGRFADLGPYDGRPVDAHLRSGVLVPGFVDAHVHYPQTRIVGAATGPLLNWLDRATFPEEARFADRDHAARVARVFAASLAASGTTAAFVYGPVFAGAVDALFEVAHAGGLRMRAGPVLMDRDCPEALRIPAERALPALEELADRWHGAGDGLLEVAVIPRFALSCSEGLMSGAADVAETLGLWTSTHLSENREECRIARERFGARDYLAVYERAGLVHDRSVFAHCIHLSAAEWDRFAEAGAVVAHCPDSNDFLGSGGMPIEAVRGRQIEVAIGTDVAAGRTFRVPRILSSAYDNGLRQGVTLDPRQLLWWGTRGGALALGWAGVGAVQPGLEADLVWLDLPPWAETDDQVLASVLFDHDAPLARRTWVRGQVVWDRERDSHPWGRWATPGSLR